VQSQSAYLKGEPDDTNFGTCVRAGFHFGCCLRIRRTNSQVISMFKSLLRWFKQTILRRKSKDERRQEVIDYLFSRFAKTQTGTTYDQLSMQASVKRISKIVCVCEKPFVSPPQLIAGQSYGIEPLFNQRYVRRRNNRVEQGADEKNDEIM
jgi:hypothetical protein